MLVNKTCFRCGNDYETAPDNFDYLCDKCNKEITDNFTHLIKSSSEELTDAICHVLSARDGCAVKEMSCSKCLKFTLEKLLEMN